MNDKELLSKRGDLTLEEVIQYKNQIIDAYKKKACIKTGDSVSFNFTKTGNKSKGYDFGELNDKQLGVEVVANMAMFMDSDNDVLLDTSWNQTISQKGTMIKFQRDHIYSTEATIGDTVGFETRDIDLTPFGYAGKFGKGLVHIAVVEKEYNPSIFAKYKNGNINQHSIGMRYRKIELATNRPEEEEEFKNWTQYKDLIINKEKAEKVGYFWLIKEIELFENSAVLFGANSLTPTLSVQSSGDGTDKKESNKSANATNSKFFSNLVQTK